MTDRAKKRKGTPKEQAMKERREALRRLRAGEMSPAEKVDLYVRGQFFFPEVVEIRGVSLEQAREDKHLRSEGLVECDGRIWYVDPCFKEGLERIAVRERQIRQNMDRDARRRR